MIHSQMEKVVASLPSAAATSTTSLVVDTLSWDYASFTVLRASNAATTFASVLKIEESDDNSAYSNVSGLVGGTDFTIPAVSDTSSTSVVKLDVDCKAKKRYLKVSVQPSASIAVAVTGRLSRGENAPTSASEAGCIGWVKG
jgi:hypothetical protein